MKNDSKILISFCDILPECCESFLLETGTEMALSTRIAYARELNWFFDYLIEYTPYFSVLKKRDITINDIKEITSQDISRYLTVYRDLGKKDRTVARKRASLSRFFNYLTNNRLIPFNPVLASVKVKIHQSDEVIHLNIEEQNNFIDAIYNGDTLDDNKKKYHDRFKVRDYALVLLLLDTGMRVSELHGIDIQDIDFDNCSVIVTRKGGNIQTIYFSDETKYALLDYIENKRLKFPYISATDPLFTTLKGDRLSIRAIEVLVKKYAAATLSGKGQNISPHKMRSSFAMAFYGETKDILALQRKLGHKNITATNIYAKATDKKMQETRNILSNLRNKE